MKNERQGFKLKIVNKEKVIEVSIGFKVCLVILCFLAIFVSDIERLSLFLSMTKYIAVS